jgi:hypothetical protein
MPYGAAEPQESAEGAQSRRHPISVPMRAQRFLSRRKHARFVNNYGLAVVVDAINMWCSIKP